MECQFPTTKSTLSAVSPSICQQACIERKQHDCSMRFDILHNKSFVTACAQMVTASGEGVVQLAEVDRLTTDQAAFMDTLAVRALEQLWQNNHPGWDVPGAGLSSLVAVKHLFQVYFNPVRDEGISDVGCCPQHVALLNTAQIRSLSNVGPV